MNAALVAEAGKAAALIASVKGTPVFDRVKAYVSKMVGGTNLSDYLRIDHVSDDDKHRILTGIIDILETKQYDRLPLVVTGQVESPEPTAIDPPARVLEDEDEMTEERIRMIVREELADVLGRIAKVLKDSHG